MRNHFSSCVLLQGHIYGFDGQVGGGGKLTCLNYETGEVKWSQGGMGTGSLTVADGKLIILSERGKLVIADASPEGFKEISSAQVLTGKCWTVPVLANGRIYARNAAGQLVCVDVSPKKLVTLEQ
jgi:outer membrane protein assembly factor BamB